MISRATEEQEWDGDKIALEISLARAHRQIREMQELIRNRELLIDELVEMIKEITHVVQ